MSWCRLRICCASSADSGCSTTSTTSYVDSLMCVILDPPAPAAENFREVVADRLLELLVAAGLRVPVGTPPLELRGVPEPAALHVVVPDLEDPLGSQRDEGEVLAGAPPALGPGHPVRVGDRPVRPLTPRVLGKVLGDQRLQLLDELGPSLGGERRRRPDVLEPALVVVQPQQQGPEQR